MNSKDFMELYGRMFDLEQAHEQLKQIVEELMTRLGEKTKSTRRGNDE